MSCGTFPHPPGTAPHEHPADTSVRAQDALAETAADLLIPGWRGPRPPGPLRVMWRNHHRVITPYLTVPAADLMATSAHFMTSGAVDAMLATLAAGIVTEGVTEIRNWQRKRRPAIKATARKAIIAGTVWATVASTWTPWGWEGIAQWPLLGGLIWAATFNHKNKAKPVPEPEQVALPPQDDPRLAAFSRRFFEGDHPDLPGANAANFVPLTRGFSLEAFFPEHTRHTISDVMGKIPQIAKLYDTSTDNVSVGYNPDHRSEARALVVVHERALLASATPNRWDGQSTYDPAAGTIELGRFLDDKAAHYLLHRPGSGSGIGILAGAMGAGKTGTMHIIAAEAGLAKLCTRCGGDHSCGECDMQRMTAVWVGDAQQQPMGIWKGKADLTGWGPEGCLELLQLAKTAADDRSDAMGNLEWTDHLGRSNTGKGFFDPIPGFPLILLPISEFPLLANHEDKALAKEAIALLVMAFTTWRKIGIHVLPDGQLLDVSQFGVRELREMAKFWNLVAHRLDEVSSNMGGIKGNPSRLSPGEVGAGYIGGVDDRSDAKFTTKRCPEYAKPGDTGIDIRHLVEEVGSTPIAYDSSVTRAMEAFGLTHQQVITEWKGRGTAEVAAEPVTVPAGAKGPGLEGLPTRDDAEAVKAALHANPAADIYRLMEATGLSVLAVGRALDMHVANGDAIRQADQYTAA